jgi:hypothetical protein
MPIAATSFFGIQLHFELEALRMSSLDREFEFDDQVDGTPSWARVWHVWTVVAPRRSIAGKWLFGRVLRRHDGRHWIFKKISFED